MGKFKMVKLMLPIDTKALIIASMHGNSQGLEMRQTLVETDRLKHGRTVTVKVKGKEKENQQ
ncbi:hypothetical protein NHG29_04100 [Aerococcaceae bacterium NML160702]|nr:hypothetical protein [Aerococcaceae bacterium NML160702]